MTQPPTADDIPGRQQLSGYVMRDYDELIATITASRHSQQLTLQDVAKRAGCTREQVYVWTAGKAMPLSNKLFMLAHALGYDLALVPREDA